MPLRDVLRVAASGLGRGLQQTGMTRGEWDISGTCEAPRPVELNGAARVLHGGRYVRATGVKPYNLLLWVRCRRCPPCLGRRRNLWAARARDEVALSGRTWFATFTFSPAWHYQLANRASARLHVGGTDLRLLPANEAFAEVVKEYGAEVTKWLKRVRKNTGARLRYILVAERHKSGRPHFHALIHEAHGSDPIRHADLTSAWTLGFTKFKLVDRDVKACWYVAKYLAKDVASRVRASLGYGTAEAARTSKSADRIAPTTWPPARDEPPPIPFRFSSRKEEGRQTNEEVGRQRTTDDETNKRESEDDEDNLHHDILRRISEARSRSAAARPPGSPQAYSAFARKGTGEASSEAVRSTSETLAAVQAIAHAFAPAWETVSSSAARWTLAPSPPLARLD